MKTWDKVIFTDVEGNNEGDNKEIWYSWARENLTKWDEYIISYIYSDLEIKLEWYTYVFNSEQFKLSKPEYKTVYVSDISLEDALEYKEERILITTLPWKAIYKHVVVEDVSTEAFKEWDMYYTENYTYIADIPEETTTPEYTMEELQEKLGENFKLIK